MNFGKNLQKLRKSRNLSQEQLAEELNVTRQSVSKWESGSSVPDMEKLATICRLFNCDLDTLVNGDVDLKKEQNSKNDFFKFMDQIGEYIEKTVNMFETKSSDQIARLIFQIILIIIVIAILNIPFSMIDHAVSNVFYASSNVGGRVIASLWSFIVNIIYVVLAIVGFFYIFKIKFLDKEPDVEVREEIKNGIDEIKSEVNNEKQVKAKPVPLKKEKNSFVDFMTTLVILCVKFWLVIFSIPMIAMSVSMIFVVTVFILLWIDGLLLLGPMLLCLAIAIFGFGIIKLMANFVLNTKMKARWLLGDILFSFVLGGVGLALSFWFLTNLTIVNEPPVSNQTVVNNVIEMNDNLVVKSSRVTFIEDDTLENQISIDLVFDKTFIDASVVNENNSIFVIYNEAERINIRKLKDIVIRDLKDKKMNNNYSVLFDYQLTVRASSENISRIRENINNLHGGDYYFDQDEFNDHFDN